jgi:hypothetical protein
MKAGKSRSVSDLECGDLKRRLLRPRVPPPEQYLLPVGGHDVSVPKVFVYRPIAPN